MDGIEFKIGDIVKITKPKREYFGMAGPILKVNKRTVNVLLRVTMMKEE